MNSRLRSLVAAGRYGAPPRIRRAVLVALLLTLPAMVIALSPGAADRFQYERSAIASGEVWRVVTGHWTHWSFDHLAWDVVAFVALLVFAWITSARRTMVVVALAAVVIPAVVWWVIPEMTVYRGLSGIDSALFVFVAVRMLEDAVVSHRRFDVGVLVLLMLGFSGKLLFETLTGSALFADSSSFVPVPLAHLAGAICGWLATLPRTRDKEMGTDLFSFFLRG